MSIIFEIFERACSGSSNKLRLIANGSASAQAEILSYTLQC
jgi:hypothetical protein